MGDPKKLAPRDKETADHSFHYCVAVVLFDGACGEAQFTQEKICSTVVRGLIVRTMIATDDALTALYPGASGGGVTVKLASGETRAKRYTHPPGHLQNPPTGALLERKLMAMAIDVMPASQVQQVISGVWGMEHLGKVSDFTRLLRVVH